MAQAPSVFDLAIRLAVAGSLAAPTVRMGAEDTGLYSGVSAGSEVIGLSLAGIQGPTFTRSGSQVNTVLPGDVTIAGNLVISGSTTTVNSTTVDVADRVIRVNKSSGANDPVPAAITGISVYRGAVASVARDHVGLFWDEGVSEFKFAVNTGGDDATLGAYSNLHVGVITASSITLGTQTANTVFAGPTTGAAAAPTFRALVNADIPAALSITSLALSTPLPVTSGGNGLATATLGDIRYASAANTLSALAGNTTTTRKFLRQTGDGANSAAPAWDTLVSGDIPLTATYVGYGSGGGGLTGDSAFVRTSLAFSVDADADSAHILGRVRLGLASSGTADNFYIAHYDQFTNLSYALRQDASGQTSLNSASGQNLNLRINNSTRGVLSDTAMAWNSAVVHTFSNTTDATAVGAASGIFLGGISVAKNLVSGRNIVGGVTSTATAASTTTLTNPSVRVQIFTGSTTQTVQLPAANVFGAGVSAEYILINRSSGTVSWQRAGSDTIDGGTSNVGVLSNTVSIIYSDGVSAWYTK